MSLDIAEASIVIDWLISKICGDTLPSDDIIDWMFRTYEWLIRYEGGYSRFVERRPLIFPTESNFPIRQHSGDLLAHEVFELVRRHAQLTDFKFQLVPQSEDPRSRLGILGGAFKGAAGTYVMDYDGVVTITYQSKLLDDIPALISVLAHELCHYYLRTGPGQPPDGDQAEEYATDLAVTFLGLEFFRSTRFTRRCARLTARPIHTKDIWVSCHVRMRWPFLRRFTRSILAT